MYYQRQTKKKNYSIEEKEEGLTLTLEKDAQHLWIKTPQGMTKIFMTKNYRKITSWVDDVDYTGFYTGGASKKTRFNGKRSKGSQMITLARKEVNE